MTTLQLKSSQRWTKQALYCHDTNSDCNNCEIFKTFGWRKNTEGNAESYGFKTPCRVHEAVAELVKLKVIKPTSKKAIALFNEFAPYKAL